MPEFINTLVELDPLWLYGAIFFFAYIENIFPPVPGDLVVVFGGGLVAIGKGTFVLTVFAAVVGATLGFITMYLVGAWFGKRIVETRRLKFIPIDSIHTLEAWFARYGYWLIVANRFLAGTRAVVSLFAGLATLNLTKTTLLSAVSALVWYGILVAAGYSLGHNWEEIGSYLATYSKIVTGLVVVIAVVIIARYAVKKKNPRV